MENGAVQANNVKIPFGWQMRFLLEKGSRWGRQRRNLAAPSHLPPPLLPAVQGATALLMAAVAAKRKTQIWKNRPKRTTVLPAKRGRRSLPPHPVPLPKTAGAKVSSSSPKAVVKASSPSTSSSRSSSKTGSSPAAAPAATQQIILEEEASAPSRSGFYLAAAVYLSAAAAGLLLFWEKKSRSTGEEKDSDNPS